MDEGQLPAGEVLPGCADHLGARTPEETAVAIAAEIIAQAWGGSGRPLTGLEVPIHQQLHPLE